jgi:glycosyltransferase involved in cell wall biosynthesis
VPRYVAAFDVGLCPYVWNDWMRSGFPLKLYEYLAAGKPVVASGNPDLAGMEPDVVLARGAAEFVAAVERALRLDADQDRARRISLAARNTWDTRTQRLLDLVSAQLARSC